MIVLGIDPALIKTGYGIVSMKDNNISYITSGTIITNTKFVANVESCDKENLLCDV